MIIDEIVASLGWWQWIFALLLLFALWSLFYVLLALRNPLSRGTDEHQVRIKRGLIVLGRIGELSPLFGLLGTVVGLWRLFGEMGEVESLETQQILAAGLGEALSTTVIGLLLALFCLVAHLIVRTILVPKMDGSAEEAEPSP